MKKKIVILIPIIVVLGYVLYKSCLLLYFRDLNGYSIDYEKVTIKEKKVEVDKSLANTKIEDLNLYIPDEFERRNMEEASDLYVYRPKGETDENGTITISVYKSVVCYEQVINDNKVMQTIGYEKLMKKNNMKTESDLIKYYFTQRKKKNIFTSSNDIKMSYLSEVCAKNSTINGVGEDKNYYFSGDLDGTLYSENNREYFMNIYNENTNEYYFISIHRWRQAKNIDIEEVTDKIIYSLYFD